jgi:hypothetical protein
VGFGTGSIPISPIECIIPLKKKMRGKANGGRRGSRKAERISVESSKKWC